MKRIKIWLHGDDSTYVERIVTEVMFLYLKGIELDFDRGDHPVYSPSLSLEILEDNYVEGINEK